MKINVKALFEVGGIQCVHKTEEAGVEQRHEARLAFVTESTVAAVRDLSSRDPSYAAGDGDPEVGYGCIVAVSRTAEGGSVGHVLKPGEAGDFFLNAGGKDHAMTGSHMLELRESLVSLTREGATLTQDQRYALAGLQDIFEMVASAPDAERFPSILIAQAYHASMIDALGDFDLPISPQDFAAKSKADLLRARIGQLDSSHPDAIASSRSLRDLLKESGVHVSESGVGAEIRSPAARQISEEAIRRTVMANDRMCNELFGSMTATGIERLSAAMIPLADLETLRTRKSNRRLSGDWVEKARDTAKSITQSGMPGYKFEMDVFSEGGRDILAISDNIGQKNGVAFVYSWPTADRLPVAEIESGRVLRISPEEIPDEAEIKRLTEVLGNIEALNMHDPDDMGVLDRARFDH